MKVKANVSNLKERIKRGNELKLEKILKDSLFSDEDIKILRKEAQKIKEAYSKSWRRARDVYVR